MGVFVGVDGGATKTHLVVVDQNGEVLGEGRSGATNYQVVGEEKATDHLQEGLRAALAAAHVVPEQVCGVAAGFAGMDGPTDAAVFAALVEQTLAALAISAPFFIVNDAVAAWAGALQGVPGAIVISGSGAIALAVNAEGCCARADGWGHWLGDEGSGFDIGRKGLQAAIRCAEGRGPQTRLLERMRRHVAEQTGEAWERWATSLNSSNIAHAQIAGFAPEVVDAAAKGDPVAREILCQAGEALAHTTVSALRRVHLLESPRVATVGSLLAHSLILRDDFVQSLRRLLPGATVHWPQMQPAEGAALLARQPELIPKDTLSVMRGDVMRDS